MNKRKSHLEKIEVEVPSVVFVSSYEKVKVKVCPIDEIVSKVKL